MVNLVLYRKYRPQNFNDVLGQGHVVRTVTNAIAANDFAHAYLFAGPRGTGKTTLARLIAKSLNCEKRKEGKYEPCNMCGSCDEVSRGVAIDLIEIDAASNRGIDEMRQLKEGIRFAPTRSKYKVFIVDEVHMLTKEAFNALLKTLEEPPAHAVFILATTEINKVPATIISRSQRFDFCRLSHAEIKKRLSMLVKKEGKVVDPKVLDAIAARADGSARDSESILGQILALGEGFSVNDARSLLGLADLAEIAQFVRHLAEKDSKSGILLIQDMDARGVDYEEFVKNTLRYIRWMMFLKVDEGLADIIGREMSAENLSELKVLAQKFDMVKLQKAADLFLEASGNIKYSPIPQFPIEMAVVELANM
ncbi:MAG: DNA polymerase III subunit gamma/tau [Candidatus Spechtbacterales bacterium]